MGSVISIVPGLSLPTASLIDAIYPVGIIYESDDSTPPNIVFGRGVWERIAGRMLIGVDESDPDFNTSGKTGGEKTHILTAQEMPAHTHTGSATAASHSHNPGSLSTASAGDHRHVVPYQPSVTAAAATTGVSVSLYTSQIQYTGSAGNHLHSITGSTSSTSVSTSVSISNSTGGQAHNNLPPFRTTYMWRRTA